MRLLSGEHGSRQSFSKNARIITIELIANILNRDRTNMNPRRLETTFFISLLLIASVVVFLIFLPYFDAIILGFTLSVLFRPLYRRVTKIFLGYEAAAAFFMIFLVCVIIFAPLIYFGVKIFAEAGQLYVTIMHNGASAPGSTLGMIQANLHKLFPAVNFDVQTYTRYFFDWLIQNLGGFFSSFWNVAATIFFSLFVFFYFLKDGPSIKEAMLTWSPLERHETDNVLDRLHDATASMLRGSLIVAICQGVLAGVGFYIFGLPQAALWSLVAGVASLVPIVGTAIVAVPAVFYLFLQADIFNAVGLALWCFFAIGSVDNFILPSVSNPRKGHLHPLLVLLSIIGGIVFFGPIGFLAGPMALSFLYALLSIYPALILKRENQV